MYLSINVDENFNKFLKLLMACRQVAFNPRARFDIVTFKIDHRKNLVKARTLTFIVFGLQVAIH